MATKDLLWDKWGVWFSFFLSEQEQKTAQYGDVLKRQHLLETLQDLIAFWALSPLSDLRNFFVYESKQQKKMYWKSYLIDGKQRKINAINYFRDGISPTWEDPKNSQGGRFIFQIDSEHQNHEQIYEWLVFYFLGQTYAKGEQINGIRFISSRFNTPLKFHYRVEVWVSFDEEAHDKVQNFRNEFVKSFYDTFQFKNLVPSFKNNK